MLPKQLVEAINEGKVVLVLGTGFTHGSKNSQNLPVLKGEELAKFLAEKMGDEYNGEPLKRVTQAAKRHFTEHEYKIIVREQFLNCRPSDESIRIFLYTWFRIYTTNVDDIIKNVPRSKMVQNPTFFNGVSEKREQWRTAKDIQIVYLHGSADQHDLGYIFSEDEYALASAFSQPWYQQLGQDFYECPIVFIGSKLDEPIFFQQLSHFAKNGRLGGRGYLVIPDSISRINRSSYEEYGIEHIQLDFKQFLDELQREFGKTRSPRDAAIAQTSRGDVASLSTLDIEALRSFHPISYANLNKKFSIAGTNISYWDRLFYDGYGPNWVTLYHKHMPELSSYDEVSKAIDRMGDGRLFVLVGEAGSGKSTFLRHYFLKLGLKGEGDLFEFQPQSVEFIPALNSLHKHLSGRPAKILIDDLHLFANEVGEVCSDSKFNNITIISSARSGEWNSRIRAKLGRFSSTATMPRYSKDDIDPLVTALDRYHISPIFRKTSASEKREKFRRSDQQLLIAMKEATSGLGFRDIIKTEVDRIEDNDTRDLFIISCIAAVPRVRISISAARLIYERRPRRVSYETAFENLGGIIDYDIRGRLGTRHETYATESLRHFITFDEFKECYFDFVRYFSDFKTPVIKNVPVLEGRLFKSILSNRSVFNHYKNFRNEESSTDLFATFERELQLDGHFWLQYGLLLRRLDRQSDALNKLTLSLDAYPDNPYAEHALAQQRLIVALGSDNYSSQLGRLIDDAVSVLIERHSEARRAFEDDSGDEYPIYTLGYYHVSVLLKHPEAGSAIEAARKYFAEVQKLDWHTDEKLRNLRNDLFRFITLGEWSGVKPKYGSLSFEKPNSRGKSGARRRRLRAKGKG